jgi:hypothetical protein
MKWVFEMINDRGDVGGVMKQKVGMTFYFNYYYLSEFKAVFNKWGSNNLLTSWINPSNGRTQPIKFTFNPVEQPNQEDTLFLVSSLNANIRKAKLYFDTLKQNAITAAVRVYTAKQSYDAAVKGVTGIDAQISQTQLAVTSMVTQQASDVTSQQTAGKQIEDKINETNNLQAQFNQIATRMSARTSEIEILKESNKKFATFKALGSTDTKDFATNRDKGASDFNATIALLLLEAPELAAEINAYKDNIIKGDFKNAVLSMDKLYPYVE